MRTFHVDSAFGLAEGTASATVRYRTPVLDLASVTLGGGDTPEAVQATIRNRGSVPLQAGAKIVATAKAKNGTSRDFAEIITATSIEPGGSCRVSFVVSPDNSSEFVGGSLSLLVRQSEPNLLRWQLSSRPVVE